MVRLERFELPDGLFYAAKDHIWAKIEGDVVRVGLDMFGQHAAGSVAYIKILPAGRSVKKGRAFGSLEAGKYIGPLRAPVGGKLIAVNENVIRNPRLLNTDPYSEGWLVLIKPSNLKEDLRDLISGARAIAEWLGAELREYREKGLLPED